MDSLISSFIVRLEINDGQRGYWRCVVWTLVMSHVRIWKVSPMIKLSHHMLGFLIRLWHPELILMPSTIVSLFQVWFLWLLLVGFQFLFVLVKCLFSCVSVFYRWAVGFGCDSRSQRLACVELMASYSCVL